MHIYSSYHIYCTLLFILRNDGLEINWTLPAQVRILLTALGCVLDTVGWATGKEVHQSV